MKSVIISDLHLSPSRPHLTQAFNRFITSLPKSVEQLYILGDLFEFWVGDDDDSDFARDVVTTLSEINQLGVKTYFQRGNRDYLVGKKFAAQTQCKILPDFIVQDICGHRALLTHGDLLCTDDIDYQRFRKKFQNPLAKWLSTCIPLSYRRKLVASIRSKTKKQTSNKPEDIMDVNPETVLEKLAKYQTKILIHGHTHRPAVHQLSEKNPSLKRFTLGDWGALVWWIEIDEKDVTLTSAPCDSDSFFNNGAPT